MLDRFAERILQTNILVFEQRLQCRSTQRDQHVRFDRFQFPREPVMTSVDLPLRGRLVHAPFAAWRSFEMLDRVGHIDILTSDTRLL